MEKMGMKRGSSRCAEKGMVWEPECSDPGGSKKKKRGGKGKERKDGDGLSPLRLVEMERKG